MRALVLAMLIASVAIAPAFADVSPLVGGTVVSAPVDDQDIQVVRGLARVLVVAGCPGAEDQHLLCSFQARELFGHHLERSP